MKPKTTISLTEARKRIFEIADEVQKPGNYYTFTENGRPKAVMMSAEEFESWVDTVETMEEFPDLAKEIEETRKAYESKEYKSWTNLEQLLAKEGFVMADKSNKKYEVSTKNKTKGGKRAK